MWKLIVTDASGTAVEKSPVGSPDATVELWEAWHRKYAGKSVALRLLRRSTVEITHWCDGEGTENFLPRSAARDFFATRKCVGRPVLEEPTEKVYFRLPESVLARVDAVAESRGLTRPQYLRVLVSMSHQAVTLSNDDKPLT